MWRLARESWQQVLLARCCCCVSISGPPATARVGFGLMSLFSLSAFCLADLARPVF